MKKTLLYCTLLSLLLTSCVAGKEETATENQVRTINLDVPLEETVKASSLFKNVKPIILETREDVLIGDLGGIYIADAYIVVHDESRNNNAVFIFDLEGHFLRKIGGIGPGPEEYEEISDFAVDKEKDELYILDPSGHKINKYNILSGKFILSIPIQKYRHPHHIQYANNSLYMDANHKTDEQKLVYEINMRNGEEIQSWLDADAYNAGWMQGSTFGGYSFFTSKSTNQVKYAGMFMDTVMTIVNDVATPFLIVQSERWVTFDQLQRVYPEKGLFSSSIMQEENRIFALTGLIECKDFVFFSFEDGPRTHSVYNWKGETKVFERLADDLALIDERFPINCIQFADDKGIYARAYPPQFAEFARVELKDILNPNIPKYEELIKLPEDANPVLFYYELKDR